MSSSSFFDRKRLLRKVNALAFATLIASGCFDAHGCDVDFDECEDDFQCGTNFVCDSEGLFAFGLTCVPATECSTDADCAGGSCFQRGKAEADNPFEEDVRGKRVCSPGSGTGGFGQGGFGTGGQSLGGQSQGGAAQGGQSQGGAAQGGAAQGGAAQGGQSQGGAAQGGAAQGGAGQGGGV